MKFSMYSIRDSLSGFMTPVIEQNDAIAMRNFQMACDVHQLPADSLMRWKPDDFTLFKIAEFDSEFGTVSPIVPPVVVCSGLSLRKGVVQNEV